MKVFTFKQMGGGYDKTHHSYLNAIILLITKLNSFIQTTFKAYPILKYSKTEDKLSKNQLYQIVKKYFILSSSYLQTNQHCKIYCKQNSSHKAYLVSQLEQIIKITRDGQSKLPFPAVIKSCLFDNNCREAEAF